MALTFGMIGFIVVVMGLEGANYIQLPSLIYYLCAFLLGALAGRRKYSLCLCFAN